MGKVVSGDVLRGEKVYRSDTKKNNHTPPVSSIKEEGSIHRWVEHTLFIHEPRNRVAREGVL